MGEVEGGFDEVEKSRGFGCFDLLGADVILDAGLNPFVMEFNVGPNLWIDNHGAEYVEMLQSIKQPLMSQITRWAALRTRAKTDDVVQLETIAQEVLVNFTRIV